MTFEEERLIATVLDAGRIHRPKPSSNRKATARERFRAWLAGRKDRAKVKSSEFTGTARRAVHTLAS